MAEKWTSRRLTPALGCEITGLDLNQPVYREDMDALLKTWVEADGLLVLRNQQINEETHVKLARCFGPVFGDRGRPPLVLNNDPMNHPQWPQILRVSNRLDFSNRRKIGTYWHSDFSYLPEPASASLLLALEIPSCGGDTMFASTAAAFDALSAPMQRFLTGFKVLHRFDVPGMMSSEAGTPSQLTDRVQNFHPLVRRHPNSGRLCLFANAAYAAEIEGLTRSESDALLAFLVGHMDQPQFIYRHRWEPHDLVIWDNRCLNHYAVPNHAKDEIRHLHRVTAIGEKPLPASANTGQPASATGG